MIDFIRNSEWLLRSLDLSTSFTNDANWFWSSRGGIFILIFKAPLLQMGGDYSLIYYV